MRKLLAAIAFGAALVGPAHAGLLGDTVTCGSGTAGYFCSPGQATVTAGTETIFGVLFMGNFLQLMNVDFDDTGVTLTANGSFGPLGGVVLNFTDVTNAFTSATLGSVSNISGLDASDFSFVGGVATLDITNANFAQGATARIDFNGVSTVPEPGTFALLGFGLLGVAVARRRRQ